MALRLVNNTPGDVSEPFIPGTAAIFSLKSPAGRVLLSTIQARSLFSNIVHKTQNAVALLPELNPLITENAVVTVESVEHARPAPLSMPRAANGPTLVIGPGSGAVDKGIYEIKTEVPTYGDLYASVSVLIDPTWSLATRSWWDLGQLAPVYLGFEYGIRNTGLFVGLRDDGNGGSLVVGGPQHAPGGERNMQQEISIGWLNWPAGSVLEVGFEIVGEDQGARLWLKTPTDAAPVIAMNFLLGQLGEFEAQSSSFSQKRVGPSETMTLFFGNAGGTTDTVVFTDYALFPNAPWGIVDGEQQVGHELSLRPDAPLTFFPAHRRLPEAKGLGRWQKYGVFSTAFWYQPGRKNTPLYATLTKGSQSISQAYLFRTEPAVADRHAGFTIEAWLASNVTEQGTLDTGAGLMIDDGEHRYVLTALDTQIERTWGLLVDPAVSGELRGYAYPKDDNDQLINIDHRALSLVRLSVDRVHHMVSVFVEDMTTPIISVQTNEVNVPSANPGRVAVGHVGTVSSRGDVNVAAISYCNLYGDLSMVDEPDRLSFENDGSGSQRVENLKKVIEKPSYGPGTDRFSFLHHRCSLTYFSGAQVDFRGRVAAYTDNTGSFGAANMWTGAGVSLFLGGSESPLDQYIRVHLGFFDCGVYGKKIGVIPGTSLGVEEILQQTDVGRMYSADAEWLVSASYRFVYRARYGIEVYDGNFIKDSPIIFIPWADYVPERDWRLTDEGIAFGCFNAEVNCSTEWEYVRYGYSTGYEAELVQKLPADLSNVFSGRAQVYVDAQEFAILDDGNRPVNY